MAIVALITMVLLPLLMRRHLCCCQTSLVALVAHHWADIVTLIACHQAGIVALVVIVSLSSMRRRLCHCCHCNCCPHDDGIIAVVDAQEPLPLSSWLHCPCNKGVVTLDLQRHCCPRCDGIVAVLKLASLPSLQWCCCHHQCHRPHCSSASWQRCRQCACVFAVVVMAIVALVTMALSLLLMRRHVSAIVKLASLPLSPFVELVLSPMPGWHCCC